MVKARDHPGLVSGLYKIRDALVQGLKTEIERSTVADILKEAGIEPRARAGEEADLEAVHEDALGTLYSNRDSWRRIADPGAGPARGRINAIFRM